METGDYFPDPDPGHVEHYCFIDIGCTSFARNALWWVLFHLIRSPGNS